MSELPSHAQLFSELFLHASFLVIYVMQGLGLLVIPDIGVHCIGGVGLSCNFHCHVTRETIHYHYCMT